MDKPVAKKNCDRDISKTELNPWQVILGHLFELDSYIIPGIIEKTGIVVDWSLTEKEDYSHKYRKAAYRPRINSAYSALPEQDQLRVAYIVAVELADRGHADALNTNLEIIGWQVKGGRLTPIRADIRELFFPEGTQYDAYVAIRQLVQKAKSSIVVVDPYLDSTLFNVLGTISTTSLQARLLTYKIPPDFAQEASKFLDQHANFVIEIRRSKGFHDRFIILDNVECWHVGCSIKDAGTRAFMLSKIEDRENGDALVMQVKNSWGRAEKINL